MGKRKSRRRKEGSRQDLRIGQVRCLEHEDSVSASEFKWDRALWKGLEPEEGKGEVFQLSPLKEGRGELEILQNMVTRPRARLGKRSHGESR